MTKLITVKAFSEKHGVPVNIVKMFLRGIHINAEENTMINEEALVILMRPLFEEFYRKNPILSKFDTSDIMR